MKIYKKGLINKLKSSRIIEKIKDKRIKDNRENIVNN